MNSLTRHHSLATSAIASLAKEWIKDQAPDLSPSADFSPEINARLACVSATAQAAAAKGDRKAIQEHLRLMDRARTATKRSSQVQWITESADMFGQAHKANSACKKGCSHCCHIPVSIGIVEAEIISKALGQKLTTKHQHSEAPIIGTPCTFLKSNTCSIYQVRPLICRTHMSMDVDDLLCRLHGDGTSIPVPYVNNLEIMMTAFEITGPQYADIRQWFPSEGAKP